MAGPLANGRKRKVGDGADGGLLRSWFREADGGSTPTARDTAGAGGAGADAPGLEFRGCGGHHLRLGGADNQAEEQPFHRGMVVDGAWAAQACSKATLRTYFALDPAKGNWCCKDRPFRPVNEASFRHESSLDPHVVV